MTVRVGEVIAVQGTRIILRIDEQSSKETLYFEGSKYKGISIREFITIQRGFREIVCMVEGEYLDESRIEGTKEGKFRYVRKVEVRPIGYFEGGTFKEGIKYMPMIMDAALLMQEERVSSIYGKTWEKGYVIGRMLKEDIPVWGCPNFRVRGACETCPRWRASLATNDRRGGQVGATS